MNGREWQHLHFHRSQFVRDGQSIQGRTPPVRSWAGRWHRPRHRMASYRRNPVLHKKPHSSFHSQAVGEPLLPLRAAACTPCDYINLYLSFRKGLDSCLLSPLDLLPDNADWLAPESTTIRSSASTSGISIQLVLPECGFRAYNYIPTALLAIGA